MSSKIEQIQILYEISMSIGTCLDLFKMTKASLIAHIKKLNCLGGCVLQGDFSKTTTITEIYSIPKNLTSSLSYIEVIKSIEELNVFNTNTQNKWTKIEKTSEGIFCYIMHLMDFGYLLLFKNSHQLDPFLLKALEPVEQKFGSACIACINNENLEEKVEERTIELSTINKNLLDTQSQLIQSEKLAGIGQLASGIAHEINTPIQYIGSNIEFLLDAFKDIEPVLNKIEKISSITDQEEIKNTLIEINKEMISIDIDFLKSEIPESLMQTNEGIEQISKIVRAMKHFVHPGQKDKQYHDIREIINNTIDISRNEWKYIAELSIDYESDLPKIFCLGHELSQVFLNLIVNASQTINEKIKNSENDRGRISISIKKIEEFVEIRISDTGKGISEKNRSRIFEPFFTTKAPGSGTGQGLAMAYTIIKKEHKGDIDFETESGKGTTFIIKLPITKGEA